MNKTTFVLLCVLAAACPPARAQVGLPWPGPGTPASSGGGGGYTGPGDVKTFTAWAGFRAYSSATRGNKFANVCQPAGSNCIDLNTDATTGKAPNAPTVNGSACNNSGHVCTVAKLYDQTGGGNDFSNGTPAQQPLYLTSALSSMPCGQYAKASTQSLSMITNPVIAQPYSISGVFERTGSTTAQNYVLANGLYFFYHEAAVNVFDVYAGTTVLAVTANDNAFHAGQGVYNGASSAAYVDGTSTSGNAGTTTPTGTAYNTIGGTNGSAGYDGVICEVGLASAAWTATDAGNMNTNQHAFWGF